MRKLLSLILCAAMLLTVCVSSTAESTKTPMTPGTYTSAQKGQNDFVTVAVTVSENAIEKVEVVSHQETPGIGAPLTEAGLEGDTPIATLPQKIVDAQSYGVDAVAGATITSYAIKNAVKDALAQAGANTDEWKAAPEKAAPEAKELTADVVVLGAGGAGLASAISALENGAESVILVEKCGAVGGDTLVCGAIYNTPDEALQSVETLSEAKRATIEGVLAKEPTSDEQAKLIETVKAELAAYDEAGRTDIFDSAAWFALQTWDGGDYVANPALVEVLTGKAKEGYDWICNMGLEFYPVIGQGAGSLWQRTHTTTKTMGTGFITTYVNKLAEYGDKVTVLTYTTAKTLIKAEDGTITGATAEDKAGNTYTLHANKGVVLSTGGFAANGKMAQQYNTSGKWDDLSKVKTTNRWACSQGDGITMAAEAGASLTDMDQIQLLYLGNLVDGQLTKYPKRVVSGTDQEIFINKEGNRFVQEDGRRDQICLASLKQTDGYFFFLESGDGTYEDLDTAISADGFTLRFLEEQGYIYVGETLDELAEKLNAAYGCTMTGEGLQATVDAFNTCVENGADPEFGRTLFTTKLTKGPWVATPRQACLHHTMGGVTIDTEGHVLDVNGSIMPGLVAAGEVTGGIHGGNRLGGNAVVDTVVFGKLAGETVTK